MAPATPRLKVLSVGGNAVSAFLTWRLQATQSCDVTLVWKAGFEAVAQYGISFRSETYGNERFKPRHVVRTPEDAAQIKGAPFDYVILCIKALPDVYDLASVIDSVVTPNHTCILVNTTHTIGVEDAIEERFPSNCVLSLVSNAKLNQLGASEFEHSGSTEVFVGPATNSSKISSATRDDMTQALATTLNSGNVECKSSMNIRQQQFERVIGPIAFHPISVMFETPSHSALLEKTGVRQLVSDVMDELITLAQAQGCQLPTNFKQTTIDEQCQNSDSTSIMWQDFVAKRPMEVETFYGSPIKLAQNAGIKLPRIETLYAIFHNLNIVNQSRPKEINGLPPPPRPASPSVSVAGMPRMASGAPLRMMPNGAPNGHGMGPGPGPRPRTSSTFTGPPPGVRRPPPMNGPMNGGPRPNGYRPSMNGAPNGFPGPRPPQSRRGSMDEHDLGEFSHLVVYDDVPGAGDGPYPGDGPDINMRAKEYQLRQREMALRDQEMRMRRGGGPPPGPPRRRGAPARSVMYDDDDEEDDFFDPNGGAAAPMIDPDNFDMMSVTSRKTRHKAAPSQSDMRANPEGPGVNMPMRGGRFRPGYNRNRSSQMLASSMPHSMDNLLDDPLMACSSNRYGAVDRGQIAQGSRANSLTASHLHELQTGPGMNGPFPRRASQSPGNPYSPSIRGGNGRPSPPNGFPGPGANGRRPSPPEGMRQPTPRHPPGHGNSVAPHQVEQRVGRGQW